jgi:hypothetical protein
MHGFAVANTASMHSIGRVRVYCVNAKTLFVPAKQTIDELYSWMAEVVHDGAATSEHAAVALRGLEGIVRTTGSMVSMLQLVSELFKAPGSVILEASALLSSSANVVGHVRELAEKEHRCRAEENKNTCGGGYEVSTGPLPGICRHPTRLAACYPSRPTLAVQI